MLGDWDSSNPRKLDNRLRSNAGLSHLTLESLMILGQRSPVGSSGTFVGVGDTIGFSD
jgi:hypothetical protein